MTDYYQADNGDLTIVRNKASTLFKLVLYRRYESLFLISIAIPKYKRARSKKDPKIKNRLFLDQDADKALRFANKIWENIKIEGKETDKLGVIDEGAKHGQRLSFSEEKNHDPTFVLDVLIKQQEFFSAEKKYIERIVTKPDGFFLRPARYLKINLDYIDIDKKLRSKVITPKEKEIFGSICDLFQNLNRREMISMGRHESPQELRESVIFEFEEWSKIIRKIIGKISVIHLASSDSQLQDLNRDIEEAKTFTKEMMTKLYDDEDYYSEAFIKVQKILGSSEIQIRSEVKESFYAVQPEADDIWGNPLVTVLRFTSWICKMFDDYFCGLMKNYDFKNYNFDSITLSKETTQNAHEVLSKLLSYDPDNEPRNLHKKDLENLPYGQLKIDIMCPDEIWAEHKDKGFGDFSKLLLDVYRCIKTHFPVDRVY